jgi:pyrroline-5-carboxylate reductase
VIAQPIEFGAILVAPFGALLHVIAQSDVEEEVAEPAGTRGKRASEVRHVGGRSAVDRAVNAAIRRARRQAAADGLKIPVQSLGEAKVRWIKP